MACGKSQLQKRPSTKHTHPSLLPPRDQDADPTPLLDTLARVALSVAARRRARRDHAISPESPAQEGPKQAQ